jgi:hypothetical protein
MSFYSQKHALNPEKVDAAVDGAPAAAVLVSKLTPNAAGLIISTLPTTNPNVAGALWSNSGVITVSAG